MARQPKAVPHIAMIVRGFRRHLLPIIVTLAIIAASALVLYLQHKTVAEIDREAMAVAETVGRQRVRSVAEGLRRSFDGAVLDTLFSASTEPSEERLDAIARRFEAGHQSYPYVSRFFLWDEHTQARAPERVLFFRPGHQAASSGVVSNVIDVAAGGGAGFYDDPWVSARLAELCRGFGRADSRVTYAVVDEMLGDVPSQVVIRWSWVGGNPFKTFVASGFVVDLSSVRSRMFDAVFSGPLQPLLREEGLAADSLYIRDETGKMVFGRPNESKTAVRMESPVTMIFFPLTARMTRLVARPPSPTWTVGLARVERRDRLASMSSLAEVYWFSSGAIVLMILALALAIRANRQAERLAALRAGLVSSVTHQLRTPLSLINLASETMALGRVESPDRMREYIDVVRRETAQLVKLVEKTLEISRLEDSDRVYRFGAVDVAEFVNVSVARFRDRLADREFNIRIQGGDQKLFGLIDAGALEQALINLLDNAVRYSNGMKLIDVRIGERQRHATIEIADYGVGISGEEIPHIFDKFYRGSNNRSVRGGFGLGLAIVQEIVAAHHGKVEVQSTLNRGTTFRVFVRQVQGGAARA